MPRVNGIDPAAAAPELRAVFDSQISKWGAPLEPYLVYGRRPGLCLAVRGMWDAIDASGLLDGALRALVCRRVASLIGCPF